MSDTPVSTQDVFAEVIGMRAEMRTMFTELALVKARNITADSVHTDHETRLRGIENDVIRIRVIATTISSIAGICSGFLTALFTHVH